jgi:hypothetical protein
MRYTFVCIIVFLILLSSGSGMNPDSSKILLYKKSKNLEVIENIFIDLSKESKAQLTKEELWIRFYSEQSVYGLPIWETTAYHKKIGINFPKGQSEKILDRLRESFPEIKKVYKHIDPKSFRFRIQNLTSSRTQNSRTSGLRISLDKSLDEALQSSRGIFSLRKIPISIPEYTDCLLQRGKTENGPWIDLPYRVIGGDCKVELMQPYIYKMSADSVYQVGVTVTLNGPSVLREGWYARIQLSENQHVTWDTGNIENRLFSISNTADSIAFKIISPFVLEWKVNHTYRTGGKYDFEKLPILAAQPSRQSKVELFVSPDSTDWTYMGTTSNGITVVNPSLSLQHLNENRTVSMYSDGDSFQIPNLIFLQGEVPFINDSTMLTITIPDTIPLEWNRTIMYLEGKSNFTSIDAKVLRLNIPAGGSSQNHYRINGLVLKTPTISVPEFKLKFSLIANRSHFNMSINRSFSCGKPSLNLSSSQIILTSSSNPILDSLILREDQVVQVLGLNDYITYTIPDTCGISFRKSNLVDIKISKDNVSILDDPYISDNIIKFKVKEGLSKGDSIIITGIPLIIKNKQTISVNCTATFYSQFSDTFSVKDSHGIDIVNLKMELSSSEEMVPFNNYDNNEFHIPSIKVINDSEINILNNEILSITLDDSSDYSFNIDQRVLSTEGLTPIPEIRSNGRNIYLYFDEGIAANSNIVLNKLKIIFGSSTKNIIKKSMKGVLKNKSNLLYTKEHITYGKPDIHTNASQYFVIDDDKTELYSITMNFKQFPLVFDRISNILFKIPDSVNLKWSSKSKIVLSQDDKKIDGDNVTLRDNQSIYELPLANLRENGFVYSQNIMLEGLRFESPIPLHIITFNILVSLDNGQSYAIALSPELKIISTINRVEINRQRLYRDYYPVQKDQVIKIILDEQSGYIWDSTMNELHYSKGDIAQKKTKIFDSITYSKDKRSIALKIKYDINHPFKSMNYQSYQYLDYGIPVTLEGFRLTGDPSQFITIRNSTIVPKISILYDTVYGEKDSKNDKEKYYSNTTVVADNVSITLGVKDYPPTDELNDPHLIAWYRWRDQYLKYLNYNMNDDASENEMKLILSKLEILNNELSRHYDIVSHEIDYDWVFWYYLAALKKRYEDIYGQYVNEMQFSDRGLNTSDYRNDYENAKRLGYDERILSAGFPKPIEGTSTITLRRQEFDRAWNLFENKKYIEAETVIYQNIDKPGFAEPYIKAANYALLGKIASALNDTTQFINPNDESEYDYECFVYMIANTEVYQEHVRQKIANWNPDIIKYLDGNNCIHASGTPEIYTNRKKPEGITEEGQPIPLQEGSLRITYGSENTAEILGMQYLVRSKQWDKLPSNMIKLTNSADEKLLDFGYDLPIVGGNTYNLTFKPKSQGIARTILTASAGILMILWIQL